MISGWKTPASARPRNAPEETMNTIIYIVGLIVVIGFLLSFFGFR
jgi:hypothetical protein